MKNLWINLAKCEFAKDEIEWLGHPITQSGITPLSNKTDAIHQLSSPSNLKKLRSFMESVHHLSKFIPNLTQMCHQLKPLLRKNTKFVWTDEHEQNFKLIKTKIAESTEIKHFNPDLETRIKCDAPRKSLGCALKQRTPDGWHTVAFAWRFLNSAEDHYIINELELLGVVCSIEHFKYYLYVKIFTVITDHSALLSKMRENKANKSYNSRLTRWVDRLLPFDFSVDNLPGTKMDLVYYISREPQQKTVNISTYDEQFIVANLDAIKQSEKQFLLNAENYTEFAARNPLIKPISNKTHFSGQLCSEIAPQNREYSEITNFSNTISKVAPNNSHSTNKIEITNIPHSLFALNSPTNQSQQHSKNFKRVSDSFQNVLMMSQSDEEKLLQIKHSTHQKFVSPTKQAHLQPHQHQPHLRHQLLKQLLWQHHQVMTYIKTLSILPFQKFSPAHSWPAWIPKMQFSKKYGIVWSQITRTVAARSVLIYTAFGRIFMSRTAAYASTIGSPSPTP